MTNYVEVIVETYRSVGEGSSASIRARPVEGQGYPRTMKVECSKKMRHSYPVGTKFKITAKVTDKEGGTKFLYTNFNWKYEVVSTL